VFETDDGLRTGEAIGQFSVLRSVKASETVTESGMFPVTSSATASLEKSSENTQLET
jgi:hypothetical protein